MNPESREALKSCKIVQDFAQKILDAYRKNPNKAEAQTLIQIRKCVILSLELPGLSSFTYDSPISYRSRQGWLQDGRPTCVRDGRLSACWP